MAVPVRGARKTSFEPTGTVDATHYLSTVVKEADAL
jgi:hypothetical protein